MVKVKWMERWLIRGLVYGTKLGIEIVDVLVDRGRVDG